METQATTGEAPASVPQPVSKSSGMIDGAELLRAAEIMDGYRDAGDDDTTAQENDALKQASGERGSDESGAETKQKDKAEPSAEKQEPEQELDTGPPRDEKGRFKPRETAQEPTQEAEESKYSKAKKEEERQRNLLANFEKDKAEFRAEQERIKQEIAAQRAEIEKFRKAPKSPDGYEFNSRQLSRAADDLYAQGKKALANGDIEAANAAFEKAEQCSISAEQVARSEQEAAQGQQAQQLVSQWDANRDAYLTQNPDAQWNNEAPTPLNLEIKAILEAQGNEFLHFVPHGFAIAAQVAKWKLGAAEASALSEKLQAAESEVARLAKLTGIKSAPVPSGMPAQRAPELNEAQLLEWARQADAAA